MTATRIAASLPTEQFLALEHARRLLRLNRSEAIQQALAQWLSARERDARRMQYIAGYQAQPEDDTDGMAGAEAWAGGLAQEEW
jgi:hypothetical protein